MNSTSERSFGARLLNFQTAIELIKKWPDYQPVREQETIGALESMAAGMQEVNQRESLAQSTYQLKTAERQEFFEGKGTSMKTYIVKIRGSLDFQYGKSHAKTKLAANIIAEMRKSKLVKLPADPSDPEKEMAVSTSQKSFGSKMQFFQNLVSCLESFKDYTPVNPSLAIDALRAWLEEVTVVNKEVGALLHDMQDNRQMRSSYYEDLRDRMLRIKGYARSCYGLKSNEYKELTALGRF